MKKLLIIPALLFTTGSIFLASCGNSGSNNAMKSPVQNNPDSSTQKKIRKQAKMKEKKMKKMKRLPLQNLQVM